MTIDELITFCEEEEYNHRVTGKNYDDASGYTRSKDKNIRTSDAIREETYADSYKKISEILRKYQKIKPSYRSVPTFRNYEDYHDAEQYTKGWNDAMDYIFPESKKARDREAARKNLKLIEAESEGKNESI